MRDVGIAITHLACYKVFHAIRKQEEVGAVPSEFLGQGFM